MVFNCYECNAGFGYLRKCIRIYMWNALQWFNRHVLKTYLLIEDCGRCEDCGRNVHDYHVPDKMWIKIYGSSSGILCYDCFCSRADKVLKRKWRMHFNEMRFNTENSCFISE